MQQRDRDREPPNERLKAMTEAAIVEAELDALLDLGEAQRAQSLELMAQRSPDRARALNNWLKAIIESKGFLEQPLGTRTAAATEAVQADVGRHPPCLEHWRVLLCVTRRGTHDVYAGESPQQGAARPVAIKLFHQEPQGCMNLSYMRHMLMSLQHPNIAQVLDVGRDSLGRLYQVTEWIDGQTLSAWVEQCRPPLHQRIACFEALLSAMSFAHACSAVHTRLRPSNVWLDRRGQVKVLNFKLTQAGYRPASELGFDIAPPAWERIDMRALGETFYWLLTDQFPSDETLSLALDLDPKFLWPTKISSQPPPPSALCDHVAEAQCVRGELDRICMKMLCDDGAAAYRSLSEALADLQYWIHCSRSAPADHSLVRRTERLFWKKRGKRPET